MIQVLIDVFAALAGPLGYTLCWYLNKPKPVVKPQLTPRSELHRQEYLTNPGYRGGYKP